MAYLSVIIAAHNAEQTLDETLKSLQLAMGSSSDKIEVIILNDSSSDKTQNIINEWRVRYPQWVSVEVSYRNVGAVRNHAVAIAAGTYITMLDSDDLLKPGSLLDAVSFLQQRQPDMLLTHLVEIRDLSKIDRSWSGFSAEPLTPHDAIRRFLIHKDFQAHLIGQFIHRDLYNAVPIPPITCYEDFAVFPSMLGRAKSIFYESSGHYFYIKRRESLSSNIDEMKMTHLVDCTLSMEQVFPAEFQPLVNCHWLDIFTKHKQMLNDEQLAQVKSRIDELYSSSFFLSKDVRFNYKKRAIKALWKR